MTFPGLDLCVHFKQIDLLLHWAFGFYHPTWESKDCWFQVSLDADLSVQPFWAEFFWRCEKLTCLNLRILPQRWRNGDFLIVPGRIWINADVGQWETGKRWLDDWNLKSVKLHAYETLKALDGPSHSFTHILQSYTDELSMSETGLKQIICI